MTENVTEREYNQTIKMECIIIMSIIKNQVLDNSFRITVVCIDEYEKKIPHGRIYNNYLEKGVEFTGVIDLLKKIELLLEEMNCPQSFSERRVFRPSNIPLKASQTDEDVKEGKLATFSIRLLFRQNASWQGSVIWHEGRTEESFRSVLELLLLVDSALTE